MKGNWSCNSTFETHLLPPIYGVEMCVALMGNVLALWLLVTKEKKNWHMGVVFSCNLVICDILYALTLPLLIHYYSKEREWVFGDAVCKIEHFLFTCNLYVSIYFIMSISVRRYLAVVHPIFTRKHIRPKHAKIISLLVWMLVASVTSPILYYSGIKRNTCSLFAESAHKSKKFMYRVFMAVIGCLFPFVVTFASYSGVIMAVYKNANVTLLQKKKVSLIVGLVFVLYTVSFVPFHILKIWYFKLREENKSNCYVREGYQVSKALVCMNMCLHPVLYMAVLDSIWVVCCRRRSNISNLQIRVGEHSSKDLALNSRD